MVVDGSDRFDAAVLGSLSPLQQPLSLIEASPTDKALACNFVGVAAGLGVEVKQVTDMPTGHYVVAGGVLESPIEVSGLQGVGSGRGNLRPLQCGSRGCKTA